MSHGPPRHSVSVAAVVVDHDRVLVIKRTDNGHWELPGGVLELDESVEDGVRREVLEETGYRVEPERLTGVYKNMPRGIVALVFRAQLTGGEAMTSVETARVEWWTPEQVKAQMEEAYAVRILDALESGPPALRSHDGHRLLTA
ncbi:NUDIX hydrolase [Actinopolymorpha sp. B11F2]|uniref:NUDIX hydrolase n=1 Tax=Actinopolymorpha sp. B11F2 TaxID=3160862 RepID=UPI0032E51F93